MNDKIQQWEIAALYQPEAAETALALGFWRRISAGATVEPGEYSVEPEDLETLESAEQEAGPSDFDVLGLQVKFRGAGDARAAS
jgi:hypothetical protein